jgi:hypothetical protein
MTKSLYLVWAGLLFGLLASGCREPNPAYVGKAPPNDAGGQQDTPPVTPGPDSAPDVRPDLGAVPPVDAVEAPPEADASADAPDARPDVGDRDEETGGGPRDVLDLRDMRRPGDDVPDVRPGDDGSRDAADVALPVDGHDAPVTLVDALADGSPLDAAFPDLPPTCSESQTRTCSTPGNPLVGACHAGMQTCTAGAWGPCQKEILPAEVETCNGVDDNCNGMTDEGCVAECVLVAPEGNDDGADGTMAKPFATVAAALTFAAAVDGGSPQRVCVAGGATCADVKSYDMDTALAVPNGARVQGNYAFDGATLTYCTSAQPPTTTLRFTAAGAQVEFGSDVKSPTELGGFTIERFSSTSGSPGAPITAVSVAGGKNVTLSGIFVTDAPAGDTTYGVDVVSGGQVTILGSSIGGGAGRMAAIGVHVAGGQVNLRSNCDGAGAVCTKSCTDQGLGIRGRAGELGGDAAADSSAVYITAASLSGSTIVGNLLCGGAGNAGAGTTGSNVAALLCEGGNCGTITGNSIEGGSGRVSLAVVLQGGGGLLEANAIATGCGTEGAFAVLLDNASARVRNNRIFGSECSSGTTGSYVGLHVVLGSAGGELDVNSNDIDPRGGSGNCQSTGVWIERTQGQPAPAGFFRNNIIAAGNCSTRTAISEVGSATLRLLENNDLYAQGPGGTTVLFHRGSTDAKTIAEVNALDGAAGNISANPRFVSYPDDLHLAEDSPCIDQGSEEGAPASDADGVARPQGEGFDIGAYEYLF